MSARLPTYPSAYLHACPVCGGCASGTGENHYLLHIVTRWKRDHNGIKIVRSGKYMLEVVAIKRSRQEKYWAIPEAYVSQTYTRPPGQGMRVACIRAS